MKLNLEYSQEIIESKEFDDYFQKAIKAADTLLSKSGKGAEFSGWLDLPLKNGFDYILKIREAAKKFKDLDTVVIIGIGGSYLGARAVIEALKEPFANNSPEIIYAGHHLSADYYDSLQQYLNNKDFGIVVISKSGTTTEPAIAFRLIQQLLIEQVGKEKAAKNIIAITDAKKGALKTLANTENFQTFVIPDDVGGRFSVLTAVGLLPISISGIGIDELIEGAKAEMYNCKELNENNQALWYAAARNLMYDSDKHIELLSSFEPNMQYFSEWWKQLFGESEGKDSKGIFPASAIFTTDLHSLGQYIQDGKRHLFETMISFDKNNEFVRVPKLHNDLDNLNYLCGKPISWINSMAEVGTCEAHQQGGVPVIKIEPGELNAFNIGRLIYFFEFACGVSAYMLGVNPFDQPGVEAYKSNMFRLLGKK
ncbi:MAG TPA: glucose-6-phosphate isomerase [Bacteroidales bacterium]|nr:glucose-6-phosphate isomerase [Bacteroidales bacterium]MDD4235509.1 glucose-6-phosphate isomerase [Bacteroidales bacterium]HXK81604.1 glucose-6-phosphate isomerase [Bacteroidales bacterium]